MEGHDSRAAIIADALEIDPDFAVGIEGPGKFEGNEDRELAAALYAICGVSGQDDQAGTVDYQGYYALIGSFVLFEDSVGFVDAISYDSAEQARAAFDGIRESVDPPEGY